MLLVTKRSDLMNSMFNRITVAIKVRDAVHHGKVNKIEVEDGSGKRLFVTLDTKVQVYLPFNNE